MFNTNIFIQLILLLANNMTKKNNSQASASDKFSLLGGKKIELVEFQKSVLLRVHEENMIFLNTKHALELYIAIKKQKLDSPKESKDE